MSSVAAGRPPARNVRSFGPNDELLYTITGARGEPRLGAILWGLGIAEVKIARALAKRGIVSMQVRINGPEFYDDDRRNEIYRRSGIDYCKLAMDKLAAERGVTSFILMGTCACANSGFHAALADSRVVGLILANPYVSTAQRVRTLGWDKVSKPDAWKRCVAAPCRSRQSGFEHRVALLRCRLRSMRAPVKPRSRPAHAGRSSFPETSLASSESSAIVGPRSWSRARRRTTACTICARGMAPICASCRRGEI